jgi:hypothetical protein
MGMTFLEKFFDRIPKGPLEDKDEDPKWESPNPTLARHVSKDAKLVVVHPKSRNIFWMKVEERIEKSGDVNLVGRRPGILNAERISIAGNTKVKPVDKIKSFESD